MAETKEVMESEVGQKVFGYLDSKDLESCRLVCKGWKDSVDSTLGVCAGAVTCTAPVNIAVIKYWGKRDTKLILPTNSSLSGTLHQDDLRSQTTAQAFPNLKEDEFFLNGKREVVTGRMQACLRLVREAAATMEQESFAPKEVLNTYKVRIISENNFPTAAGLASSASGLCCLVFTLAKLYNLPDDRVMLSTIARQGSGSACRSMFGGFSKWMKGDDVAGSDSVALPVVDENHWKEMRVLILVANDQKKAVGSTEGMQKSLEGVAGEKLKRRAEITVPRRMEKIEKAIHEHDFDTFARISMKDSDDFHDVCRVTEPPLHYMNETSRLIVRMVNSINKEQQKRRAGYTFDAGPNGVLYLLSPHLPHFLSATLFCFPNIEKKENYVRNAEGVLKEGSVLVSGEGGEEEKEREVGELFSGEVVEEVKGIRKEVVEGGWVLKYVLGTRIGPGPLVVEEKKE